MVGDALPIPAFVLGGWPATGITLGTVYGFQLLPAVVAVYRSRDISGVSVPTWIMAWTEALLWGIYGFGPRMQIYFAATSLVMSSAVLVGLFIRRSPDGANSDPDAALEIIDPAWPGGY